MWFTYLILLHAKCRLNRQVHLDFIGSCQWQMRPMLA